MFCLFNTALTSPSEQLLCRKCNRKAAVNRAAKQAHVLIQK